MTPTRVPLKTSLLAFAALCAAHVPAHAARSLTVDINGDGSADTLTLERADDHAALVLALSGIGEVRTRPIVSDLDGPDAAFLEAASNGSVKVQSSFYGALGIAWDETITFSWRRGRLVVSGYTFSAHTRPEGEMIADCDINLLTGRGTDRGQALTLAAAATPARDWDKYAVIPARCYERAYPEPFGVRP